MTSLGLAIAVKGEWEPDQLLRELRSAGADASTEIHIACDPQHAPASAPDGLTIHTKANASLFDLWSLAIAQSRSDWVAVLHADALPAHGWLAAMHAAIAHDPRPDGYTGPVEPRFGPSDPRMIGYLTEYVQFHRPLNSRLSEIPGNNLVLPRVRLEASGDFSRHACSRQVFHHSPLKLQSSFIRVSSGSANIAAVASATDAPTRQREYLAFRYSSQCLSLLHCPSSERRGSSATPGVTSPCASQACDGCRQFC